MKAIKIFVFGILVIIAIPFIIALFIKKEYAVEREIVINKSQQEVFDYIKYLKNQNDYGVWASRDKDMRKEYRGTDGTEGFVSAWDSDNKEVGKGEQEIKKITEGERIDFELRFIKPFSAIEPAYLATEVVSDIETKVKWGFSGHMKYPMNIMLLVMQIEKMISKDLDTGLANLKNILEADHSASPDLNPDISETTDDEAE